MLIISEPAESDVTEICSHIANFDIESAKKTAKEFSEKFRLLESNPKLGRSQDSFILNLRSFPFKKYVIFYFPIENGVEIYRVLHGARNVEELFDEYFEGLKP